MQETKLGSLVWTALVAVPIGWSISRIVESVTDVLPPVPWLLPVLLLFLAILIYVGARGVRAWVQERRYDGRLDAIRVARLLALAKAAQFGGAAVAGAYIGLTVLALGMLDSPMGRNRSILAGIVVLVAVAVVVTGHRLERACVAPPPPDDEDGSPSI
ncbi:MAG: DUF3180 family protein [Jiangellaceae bacterium]